MEAIVQYILNMSKLEISLIRISQAEPNTFMMAIESRVTNSGPLGATMSAMNVDMVGPAGLFARLRLPEIKTSSRGTDVHIPDQKIEIVDMEAYKAFVKSLMLDEQLTLTLENGKGTIKALGMTNNIVYKKKVVFNGMNGPKTEIVKTTVTGEGEFQNILSVWNPSPVEIDLGVTLYEYRNIQGEPIAEQRGKIYLVRGENEFPVTGRILKKGSVEGNKARLVGMGVEHECWLQETNKYMNMDAHLTPEFVELMKA